MKYLILGAGPAGLAFGNYLNILGETDFLVLEKEESAGGLCRSMVVDGTPLDTGGGHFLDTRRPMVNNFLFRFMQRDEWNLFERDSRISVKNNIIQHPFESNIWQMDLQNQVEYLKSIALAGCNLGTEMPQGFVDWIYWKLGKRIAQDYMIPYNSKMFGKELDQLGTYWLEKLPSVSFDETLISCLTKKAFGTEPGHAQFLYPKKYGYGEVWLRMADAISEHIEYDKRVVSINFNKKQIKTEDACKYCADNIVTTIPWREFKETLGLPKEISDRVHELKHMSTCVDYFAEELDTDAHWIYYPDLNLAYHRILVRHNFCTNAKGYWTETNGDRIQWGKRGKYSQVNEYAYPLNTLNKPQIMETLLSYARKANIYGLGRWGEHSHINSDVTVEHAMKLAELLCGKEHG